MANHEEARVKLKNAEQNELKSEAKSNTRKTLKITKKTFKMNNCLMNYF